MEEFFEAMIEPKRKQIEEEEAEFQEVQDEEENTLRIVVLPFP